MFEELTTIPTLFAPDMYFSREIITSAIFLFVTGIGYFIVCKYIDKKYQSDEQNEINKIRVKRIIWRNIFILFMVMGTLFIWREEIKTAILSISFAVMALVVLFKEILINFFASFVIGMNNTYKIGDMIELKGKMGTISDRTLMNTKIILKENYLNTGREFVIPNALFLTNEVQLLTRLQNYGVFFIEIFIPNRDEAEIHVNAAKSAAKEVINGTYSKRLVETKLYLQQKEKMEIPSHKPFVSLHLVEKPYLTIKYVCNPKDNYWIREKIIAEYLRIFKEMKKENKPLSIIL